MPNESINLYIAMSSGGSERTLTSLADKTRELDKETQQLQRNLEEKITPPRRGRRVRRSINLQKSGQEGHPNQDENDGER